MYLFSPVKLFFKTQWPNRSSINPVPLPDLYFDSFSYPAASIVFGDMAVVSLFLRLFFLANPRSCLERYRLAPHGRKGVKGKGMGLFHK